MAKTARAVDEALADASRLRGEARSAPPGDAGRWSAAMAAAKRAEGLLAQGEADAPLKGRVDALMAGVERERAAAAEKARQIEIDRVLLAELESVRGNRVVHRRLEADRRRICRRVPKGRARSRRDRPDEAGRWLASRTDPIELAGYLDDWAFVRRAAGRPEADWRRLVAAARGGDPDPWRDALRAKLGSNDAGAVAEFRRMADDPELEDQPAAGTPVAGPSAQVRLRRRRAGRAGPAAGRSPLSGRLPHPFRAGLRPRPAGGRPSPPSMRPLPRSRGGGAAPDGGPGHSARGASPPTSSSPTR